MAGTTYTSASQAWAVLKRHARDEIATLRLQDLCQDNDRVSSLVTVHNSNSNNNPSQQQQQQQQNNSMLLIDLSRQRMTLETLNHLLKLSVTRGVRQYITRLAWGQNDPNNPLQILQKATTTTTSKTKTTKTTTMMTRGGRSTSSSTNNNNKRHHHRITTSSSAGTGQQSSTSTSNNNNTTTNDFPIVMPSMHLAYRAPKNQGLHMLTLDGTNALTSIHREWDRLERLSDSIRRKGTWRGANGKMIRDVVVVGRGVAIQALQFITNALQYDESAIMATKFGLDSTTSYSSSSFSSTSSFAMSAASGAASNAAAGLVGLIRQTTAGISTPFHHGGADASSSSSAGGGKGTYNNNNNSNIRPRKIHFLTSVDPLAAASLVSKLDAGSTMVISFALKGNEETGLATQTMKNWLLQELGGNVGTTTTTTAAAPAGTSSSSSSSKATGNTTTAAAANNINNNAAPVVPSSSNNSINKRTESILSKHMLLVTGNDQIVTTINKPESVFLIPEHSRCEAFISCSAATLLPMSIVYGWPICEQFLAGGHDLDIHFVESNPRHNIPVLLALTDVWNDVFLSSSSSSSARGGRGGCGGGVGRVVTPFSESMKGFPGFVAALEAQTCSGSSSNNNNQDDSALSLSSLSSLGAACCSSLVLDGGSDSAYDRALYQSQIQYSEMVMVSNTQLKANTARTGLGGTNGQRMDDVYHHADALICSLFGHADELAFGSNSKREETLMQHRSNESPNFLQQQQSSDTSQRIDNSAAALAQQQHQANHSEGNRPSTLLLCGTLDAFALGQLIACSEHRAVVKARIWDIDPFTREAGYAMRTPRSEQFLRDLEKIYLLQEMGEGSEDSDNADEDNYCGEGLNLSSKTILGHYARVRS